MQKGPSVEAVVQERYTEAARNVEPALCCPTDYDPALLEAIPAEVRERDYGCGDPSRHLERGDCVLDLGSGSGKACFIAAQVVGPSGRVIGIDANDEMLTLARRCQAGVAEKIGFDNLKFLKARIQDLRLDLERLDEWLSRQPVTSCQEWRSLEEYADRLRCESPLIADNSIDVVVSNCVLNLVTLVDRCDLFTEISRVLRPGGRAVISDIVSTEDIPEHLRTDATLWSGCLSGAFREDAFLEAFETAGFTGIEILARQAEPWAVIEGIEFRSLTVQAFTTLPGPLGDRQQEVIYRGPWKTVTDDSEQTFHRGRRQTVCEQTYQTLMQSPYAGEIIGIPSRVDPDVVKFDGCDQQREAADRSAVLPGDTCSQSGESCC